MPLPIFASGQPLTAPDANTLARQGVITVTTTTERDALPAPHEGMVCYVEAATTLYVRVLGSWKPFVQPWQAWTPTLAGAPVSAVFGAWTRLLDTVHYHVEFLLSGPGTGTFGFALPTPRAITTRRQVVGDAVLWDQSASAGRVWHALVGPGGGANANLVGPSYEVASAAVPWTWASGDQITVTGTYDAA